MEEEERQRKEKALQNFTGARVLLVDDNDVNQVVAEEVLRRVGVSVTIARDGVEALQKLDEASVPPHLILMDLQMPNMDGFEATEKIVNLYGEAAPPIVAMTAHTFEEEEKRCLSIGMKGHVSKPFDVDQMFDVLSKYFVPETSAVPMVDESDVQDEPNDDLSRFDGLTTFDVSEGIRRLMGQQEMFLSLLQRFYDRYVDSCGQVSDLVASGNYKEAEMLTHAIRGASGNIAATDVYNAASRLDDALGSQDNNDIPALVVEFEEILEKTMDQLLATVVNAEVPESQNSDDQISITDITKAKEYDGILDTMLRENNFAAKKVVDEFLGSLPPGEADADREQLRAAVDALDFEAGLVHLNAIAKHFDLR